LSPNNIKETINTTSMKGNKIRSIALLLDNKKENQTKYA